MEGFPAKYGCKMLVWYEVHEIMIEAITRVKQSRLAAAQEAGVDRAKEPRVKRSPRSTGYRYRSSPRHCERSEAIHRAAKVSGLLRRGALLAMTAEAA